MTVNATRDPTGLAAPTRPHCENRVTKFAVGSSMTTSGAIPIRRHSGTLEKKVKE